MNPYLRNREIQKQVDQKVKTSLITAGVDYKVEECDNYDINEKHWVDEFKPMRDDQYKREVMCIRKEALEKQNLVPKSYKTSIIDKLNEA